MNICVFGAASSRIDKKYFKDTQSLCQSLAKQGHNLVFGAGGTGLMGAAAKGFQSGGGRITGVIPTFFKEENIELIFDECDELIFTETMQDRKLKMETLADAFLIVPGGIGTFEELFEILTLKQLKRHSKPIAIYNIDGYYDLLCDLLTHSTDTGFIPDSIEKLYICTNDTKEICEYITNTGKVSLSIDDMKNK